jgi:hypothetical protein
MRRRLSLLATIALLAALGVRADELTLKDGSKIDGTIVGFEGNSFRVKTSYGFAVVKKDQIASIRITDLAKESVATKKPAGDKSKVEAAAKPASVEASAASAKSATPQPVRPASIRGATTPSSKIATAASALKAPASAVHAPVAVRMSSPSAAAPPVAPATPLPIREQVSGNTYTNDTYGFSMFKPPDWELVEGARTLLPGAITAMGTDDQTTYLLIGQDPAGKSIESQMNATVSRLGGIMDNFRPLAETRVNISGSPAIERRFHGTVDQRDWSGVVVLIPRGARVFTIFGMTFAETDLVQIQENVISRTISSLQFAKR